MKTWKDIRTATLNLGFEKIKAYEKNRQAYVDAYNWRQGLIASTIGGVIEQIGVGCDGRHRHLFDLYRLAQSFGEEFIGISQTGVTYGDNIPLDGWRLTDNRYFMLPEDFTGHRVIHALVMPAPINTASEDSTECRLPDKWRNIMPYLMANRLYLDDDAAKAGYYWNLYTDMRDEILAKENIPRVSVIGGFDIDRWCF